MSVSNSLHLIIAKVLANKFREVMGELVGPFQSAFFLGEQLVDGAMAASKILAAWKRKARWYMWKVNFAKAYDSLKWNFIWKSKRQSNFAATWVAWMKRCFISYSFLMLVNGSPEEGMDLAALHGQTGIPP